MTKQKEPQSQGEVRQDSRCDATPVDSSLDRRSFLRRTGSAALGIGAMGLGVARLAAAAPVKQPTIKRYVTLGKTGLEISDIGFGSGGCRSPKLVRHCLDRGVNYFDTAEWYRAGKYNAGEYIEKFIGSSPRSSTTDIGS